MQLVLRLGTVALIGLMCFPMGCAGDEPSSPNGPAFGRMDAGAVPPPADAVVRQQRCGDGIRGNGEQCDDGNLVDGDGCDRMCRTEVLCGNGRVDRGEGCDDGNQVAGDGCNSVCQPEPLCGNGEINDGEECDEDEADCVRCAVTATDVTGGGEFLGHFQALSFDRFTFTLPADGLVQLSATDGANGCPVDMDLVVYRTNAGRRGDEVITNLDSGPGFCPRLSHEFLRGTYEVVVSGAQGIGAPEYVFTARFAGQCGDRVVNAGEQCDDGNTSGSDGCSAQCEFESTCGNGNLEGLEECDDGNESNGDGCDRGCTFEVLDLVRAREQVESSVGDGATDVFRFIADGPSTLWARSSSGGGRCAAGVDTVLTLFRIDEGGERQMIAENDDAMGLQLCSELSLDVEPGAYELVVGDLFGGDPIDEYVLEYSLHQDVSVGGVYPGAFLENGDDLYVLSVAARARIQIRTEGRLGGCAGDSQLWLSQERDAGLEFLEMSDDTDRSLCSVIDRTLDVGEYKISVNGFEGVSIDPYELAVLFVGPCGDGNLNIDEDCDDGNGRDGDGCSSMCRVEALCGNGAVDDNEECDDGNMVNGDGCDAGCSAERFDIITGRDQRAGVLGLEGQDVWRFTADALSVLNVSTHDGMGECPEGLDTIMQVYRVEAGNRVLVGESDDLTDDIYCSGLVQDVEAGNYEIVITDFQGDDRMQYGLDFHLAQDVSEPGDYSGAFVAQGDDLYRFTIANRTDVRLTTGAPNGCPGNTIINLSMIDDEGNAMPVGMDDDGGVDGCSNLEVVLDPGTYEAQVIEMAGGDIESYVIAVRLGDTGM